jgi:hypothetical protein
VLAALNNAILALADRLQIVNLAAQRRIFAARPDEALRLLLQPNMTFEKPWPIATFIASSWQFAT